MFKRVRATLYFLSACVVGVATQAQPTGAPQIHRPPSVFRSDRILVQPKKQAGDQALAALHAGHRARLIRRFEQIGNLEVLELPPGADVAEFVARYRGSDLIEFAEPDYWVHASVTPNDPKYLDGTLWALHNTGQSGGRTDADIDAPEGWETLPSATNIIVAVVDSGVRFTHEDLLANMWINPGEIPGNRIDDDRNGFIDDVHGINAITNTGDPSDDGGHGTHVAGILGAVGNNGRGVIGVAWSLRIMACKFLDRDGKGSLSDAVQCIDYARRKGAKVINASWGGPDSSSSLRAAIESARQAGIIFVAAAGNEATDNDRTPNYPSSYDLDNIVAVAATTRNDALADYSNFGARTVDLAAPGSVIFSTWNGSDSDYLYLSGTSMAAPQVTGVFALMRARYPAEGYSQLISRVLAAASPVSGLAGKCATGGRVNLADALGPSLLADFGASPVSGTPPLMVRFTNTSVGTLAGQVWNFGDQTPETTEENPEHTYPNEGNFTVTLTVTDAQGATRSKSRTISVVANYQIRPAPFNWIDPGSMTQISLADNGVSPAQSLPFTFNFYGQGYQQLYVAANGLAGFVNQGLNLPENTDLPNAGLPNAALFPYWDDLNPAAGGSVRIGTTGAAPDRRVVISWVNVPRRAKPPTALTFQAVLFETSSQILFQYLDVAPNRNQGAGRSASIGVENQNGLVAARYSVNGSSPLANSRALLFVPASSGGMLVTPSTNLTASGDAGGPFVPASQTYTIQNAGSAALAWTIAHEQDWVSISASNGTLATGQHTNITVLINTNAIRLPAGRYVDSVAFVNANNGAGNLTVPVELSVNGTTGILEVTPGAGLNAAGIAGGPFSPSHQIYTLINTGDAALTWVAQKLEPWTSLSAPNGVLAAGESATLTVAISADANDLAPGAYADLLTITNVTNGQGGAVRILNLAVDPAGGILLVQPDDVWDAAGPSGGPFSPNSAIYTLTNAGSAALDWTVAHDQAWLSLSGTNGALLPGQLIDVMVTLNDQATLLPPGEYQDTLNFASLGGSSAPAARWVRLTITPAGSLRLSILRRSPDAGLALLLSGDPDRSYVIESSADLATWIPVATNQTSAAGSLEFSPPDSNDPGPHFYRATPFP